MSHALKDADGEGNSKISCILLLLLSTSASHPEHLSEQDCSLCMNRKRCACCQCIPPDTDRLFKRDQWRGSWSKFETRDDRDWKTQGEGVLMRLTCLQEEVTLREKGKVPAKVTDVRLEPKKAGECGRQEVTGCPFPVQIQCLKFAGHERRCQLLHVLLSSARDP